MRINKRDPRTYHNRQFVCVKCGIKVPAGNRRKTTLPGHVKDMWCIRCACDSKFIQLA